MEKKTGSETDLPGFRFHPTEEEILDFYLRRAAAGKKLNIDIISTVNLYLYDPWDLPAMAKMGEREWYFFVPRDRRQGNGGRPNRTTERGFWKATGSDRHIRSSADPRRVIGLKKTLVYYRGRAPRGAKTDWIMNEYRLPEESGSCSSISAMPREDIVLCKVYRKATPLRELEQRAAMEEESRVSITETSSTSSGHENLQQNFTFDRLFKEMKEEQDFPVEPAEVSSLLPELTMKLPEPSAGRQLPSLPALQVPTQGSFDWLQDPFINQLRSPWLEQWSPLYAQMLNF